MEELCGKSVEELRREMAGWGEPLYRAEQLFHWVYQKQVVAFEEMVNMPKSLLQKFSAHFVLPVLSLAEVKEAEGEETKKFLWRLRDGYHVESVLIYSFHRRTLCLSSQVGCGARCSFCASGKHGWVRNLTPAEIVEQALLVNRYLKECGEKISHVVFMGMGEPLDNLDNVLAALAIFHAKEQFNLSLRRITLSTVGVVPGIEALTSKGIGVNLALSLHAPDTPLRRRLIPYERRYPLNEVLQAVEAFSAKTGRDITYEYTMLEGINDQVEHAEALGALLRGKQCCVNLIPYNPVQGLRFRPPTPGAIAAFTATLDTYKVRHKRRYTKGRTMAAACGQLALAMREQLEGA